MTAQLDFNFKSRLHGSGLFLLAVFLHCSVPFLTHVQTTAFCTSVCR